MVNQMWIECREQCMEFIQVIDQLRSHSYLIFIDHVLFEIYVFEIYVVLIVIGGNGSLV